LASGDAVASAREHVGAGGGNGGSVFSARKESEEGGRNESSSRARGVLRTLRPDRWGHDRCMAATVCPRGSTALRSVGHD
jgi:hypothetical protein